MEFTSCNRRAAVAGVARVTLSSAVLAVAGALPLSALAADAPNYFTGKTIKIIVANTAGGTSDILARLLAQKMTDALGTIVIVENKAGATGNLGSDYVAKAAPDGLTLLMTDIGSLAIAPSVFPQLPFDPVKDFAPVIMVAYSPHILAVYPGVPANNVKELVALAKAKPDSLNFAISGVGGANHLAGIDFAMRTGIKWSYIPYKGGSQAIGDVMGGQAQVIFNGMVATYPSVKGGKLKAIAISSLKRFPAAPEIPTVAESGVPGFETGSFQGVMAPAGTPAPVVATLNAAITKSIATPEVQERLAAAGAEARGGTPAEFGEFVKSEKARWAKVVKESGAKFE